MSTINKVLLLGWLGRDPDARYMPNGTMTCALQVATSKSFKDKESGVKREETEWSRVILYDRKAEVANQYLKKGSQVHIEGRLKTKKWTDKNGIERYTTEVIADVLQLMGSKPDSEVQPEQQTTSTPTPTAVAKPVTPAAQQPQQAKASSLPDDDDIPF